MFFYYVISNNVKPLILVQTHIKAWLFGFIHMMEEILFVDNSLVIRITDREKKNLDITYSLTQVLEGF